jgi:hypothetical protein
VLQIAVRAAGLDLDSADMTDSAPGAVAAQLARHDLERFCHDFLGGTGDEFRRCAGAAEQAAQLSGTQRLARIEQQLKRD